MLITITFLPWRPIGCSHRSRLGRRRRAVWLRRAGSARGRLVLLSTGIGDVSAGVATYDDPRLHAIIPAGRRTLWAAKTQSYIILLWYIKWHQHNKTAGMRRWKKKSANWWPYLFWCVGVVSERFVEKKKISRINWSTILLVITEPVGLKVDGVWPSESSP